MIKYFSLFALFTSLSFASVPTFKASKMTCAELKEAFTAHQEIKVIFGMFGMSRQVFWSSEVEAQRNCPGYKYVDEAVFDTRTGNCRVGYGCESWPQDSGSYCRTCAH